MKIVASFILQNTENYSGYWKCHLYISYILQTIYVQHVNSISRTYKYFGVYFQGALKQLSAINNDCVIANVKESLKFRGNI